MALDDKSVKTIIKEELEKLSKMTWGARLQYIWDYYKPLMAILLGIILCISIGVSIYRNMQINHILNVYCVNSGGGVLADTDLMAAQFAEYIGGIGPKDEIFIDASISLEDGVYSQYGYAASMKLTTVVASGQADVVVVDETQMQSYLSSGGLTPLTETCTPKQMEAWEQKGLLLVGPSAEGTEKPVAVRVTGSPIFEMQNMYLGEEAYAILLPQGKNVEMGARYVEYLTDGIS